MSWSLGTVMEVGDIPGWYLAANCMKSTFICVILYMYKSDVAIFPMNVCIWGWCDITLCYSEYNKGALFNFIGYWNNTIIICDAMVLIIQF